MATAKLEAEPLSCPFCGKPPQVVRLALAGDWCALCKNSDCLTVEVYRSTRAAAIAAWNTRARKPGGAT